MRKTAALMQVGIALVAGPPGRRWGYELKQQTGIRSGVLYPLLHRLLDAGWLSDGWEDQAVTETGRPPRRYYVLTAKGRRELTKLRLNEGQS